MLGVSSFCHFLLVKNRRNLPSFLVVKAPRVIIFTTSTCLRRGDTSPNDANLKELPYRLHEYAWWNLIDIGEMYVALQADGEGPG